MTSGKRGACNVSLALIAAVAMLLASAPARANPSCNIGDIFNAAANAFGSLTSGHCLSACADDGGCLASILVAGGLEAAAASNPGSDGSFCRSLGNVGDTLSSVQGALDKAHISVDLSNLVNSPVDPLSILSCGCDMDQDVNQFVSDIGDCACDLLSLLPGVHCNCTPPPPVQANCALPTTCQYGSSDPACQNGIGPIGLEQDGSSGAFVSVHLGTDPNCGALLYCFCPKPLVPTWTGSHGIGAITDTGMFTCACPDGTRQVGVQAGVPVCLCNITNFPPKIADNIVDMCSLNLLGKCQPNQIVVKGKCVTPCANPAMGMTPDGACCDPNQISACGQCCPPHWTPNPVNGGCVRQTAQ
jgi:hypothetical protein